MYQITVSEEIKNACPIFKGAAVYAEVTNTALLSGMSTVILPVFWLHHMWREWTCSFHAINF